MRVLISGAGIAGPTLAYWLVRYGMKPTIVELAPELRTGGYVIDFWGAGFSVAERMGIIPEIMAEGYRVREVRSVNHNGKTVAAFPAKSFDRATQGRYVSLSRGDLASSVFRKLADKVETIFDDNVSRIEQSEKRVHVEFESGRARDFDLVVGADGLHSRVRELVFGPQARFEKYLGYKVAAFEAEAYTPRDELVYLMFTEVGKQVARFSMRGNRTMFLFTYADDNPLEPGDIQAHKAALHRHFGNSGWECSRILKALDATSDLYFDRVSQIQMEGSSTSWSKGRVALLGDAASCVSLLAGQGSGLAMVAAYILAGELHRADGDHTEAFTRYQQLFGPFVLRKQKSALRFAGTFAPKSQFSLFMRNLFMNLMTIPWVADLVVGHDLADNIVLPQY
jgi:2-polyprenyl-6-methoxyphenol hydroxylase-like FAD-dependent oxidoreductase